jgi:hypothetical protein
MAPKGSFPVAHDIETPKGGFPVAAKPDGSFPTTQAAHGGTFKKSAIGGVKSISKTLKMMNSCFKDSGRAVYPMSAQGYKSLMSMKDDDNDSLPLLEYVASRCEETLDFRVGITIESSPRGLVPFSLDYGHLSLDLCQLARE